MAETQPQGGEQPRTDTVQKEDADDDPLTEEEEERRRLEQEREEEERRAKEEEEQRAKEAAEEAKETLIRAAYNGDAAEIRKMLPDARLGKTLRVDGPLNLPGLPPGTDEALITSAGEGHESVVELLLDAGAPPSATVGGDRATALHAAAGGGYVGIASALIDAGAAVDAPTKAGIRPMHIACGALGAARPELVRLLLKSGADAAARDADGRTPSKVALGLYVAYDGKGSEAAAAVGVMEQLEKRGVERRGRAEDRRERRERERRALGEAIDRVVSCSPPRHPAADRGASPDRRRGGD